MITNCFMSSKLGALAPRVTSFNASLLSKSGFGILFFEGSLHRSEGVITR